MAKELQHFVLALDDTSCNPHEKKSARLQSELATFCCAIIPAEYVEFINDIFVGPEGLLANLQKNFPTAKEFHFTEIYNHKNAFENIELEETVQIVGMFAEIINYFDIDVVTFTLTDKTLKSNKFISSFQSAFYELVSKLPTTGDGKNKSLAIINAIWKAKAELEKTYGNPVIDYIVCDEGVKTAGTKVDFPLADMPTTTLSFESSAKNPLLQIADFAAWSVTRYKHSLDNKTKLNERERLLLKELETCGQHFINLELVEIDPDNLPDYDTVINKLEHNKNEK